MAAKKLCGARARIPPLPNMPVQQLHTEVQAHPARRPMDMVELQSRPTAPTQTLQLLCTQARDRPDIITW